MNKLKKHTLILTALAVLPLAAHAAPPMDAPDLMPVKLQPAPEHAPVELVRGGKPLAVVYVAPGAFPATGKKNKATGKKNKKAGVVEPDEPSAILPPLVRELLETVKAGTGAELQLVTNPPAADQAAIVIGDCEETRKAGIDAAKLPIEGFEIKTAPNRVYLVGSTVPPASTSGAPRPLNDATSWAVADFLERFVGVRWYWPTQLGGRTVVKTADLQVPPVHYADAPAFRFRDHFPQTYGKRMEMQPLLSCLRFGSSWPYTIAVHQPQSWTKVEWERDNQRYPTMFALKADGTRSKNLLCYSSKETLAFLLEGCEKAWAQDTFKYAGPWVAEQYLSISPGDSPIDCQCENCKKLYEPDTPHYGATRGEASRIMALFVKQACEEVKKRWPDKKVMYLPYWNYAHCPEDIDFPDNLEIQFCTTGFGGFREVDTRHAINNEMRQWSQKVGGKITSWEYTVWIVTWTKASFQFPHVAQAYYRENRDILAGSFINGGAVTEWTQNQPSLYMLARLLWNPDINVDATLDEMCLRLYGPGAATSRKLLQLMCDRWEKAPWSEKLGAAGHISYTLFNETWPPEVVAEMDRLYRQARAEMKDDPEALARFDYWNCQFEAFLQEAKQRQQFFAVPRRERVVIDGKAEDWGDAGLLVDGLNSIAGAAAKTAGFEPSFRLAWDDKGLLVLAKVLAPDFTESEQDDALDTGDGIELFLTPKVGESDPPKNPFPDLINVVVAPGMDAKHPELRVQVNDMRQTGALKAVTPKVDVARSPIPGGYLLEARLPWDAVGVAAKPGVGAGFQFYAVRRQGEGKPFRAVWFPALSKFEWMGKTQGSAYSLHPLRLVD